MWCVYAPTPYIELSVPWCQKRTTVESADFPKWSTTISTKTFQNFKAIYLCVIPRNGSVYGFSMVFCSASYSSRPLMHVLMFCKYSRKLMKTREFPCLPCSSVVACSTAPRCVSFSCCELWFPNSVFFLGFSFLFSCLKTVRLSLCFPFFRAESCTACCNLSSYQFVFDRRTSLFQLFYFGLTQSWVYF